MSVARAMNGTARIRVASGPDRGGVFELGEAMVNIGRDPQSEIALTDADVPDYQLSVVRKNDRFVIFTPLENSVQVDGQWIPAERWMWLPASARIRLTQQTTLQFESDAPAAAAPASHPPVARFKGPEQPAAGTGKDRAKRKQERRREDSTVARFITDRGDETLVQLGADGHLPELSLQEETRTKTKEKRASGSSSVWAYAALAASFVMSIGLLLVDFGPGRSSRAELAEALAGIV
ncbi:MAG: FHA domain-containing protein, partial [Planctomycetaceae bacterium]